MPAMPSTTSESVKGAGTLTLPKATLSISSARFEELKVTASKVQPVRKKSTKPFEASDIWPPFALAKPITSPPVNVCSRLPLL